jgi:hypothetical protein
MQAPHAHLPPVSHQPQSPYASSLPPTDLRGPLAPTCGGRPGAPPGVRRRAPALSALTAGALALALAAEGCSEVIGLGPEPTRARPAAEYVCGLPPHPNPACDACLDQQCCDLSWRCAESSDGCADQSQCAVDCAYDAACLDACDRRYAAEPYAALQSCLVTDCLSDCLPSGPCRPLIACCAKAPGEGATRDACVDAVNRNDPGACQALIDAGSLEPFCPELAASRGQAL